MPETIDTEHAKEYVDRDDATVIDVLGPDSYEKVHLPGAINIPADADDFEERVEEAVPDKDAHVMVYCRDEACQASPKAYEKMRDLGYENVVDFEAGLAGWRNAGNEFEGEGRQRIEADVEG